MLELNCPWCGPRNQSEFGYGGEAHIVRPLNPEQLSDVEWGEYLFMRDNPKGLAREQWVHAAGCRRWFNVERDTVTYRVVRVYAGPDSQSKDSLSGSATTGNNATSDNSGDSAPLESDSRDDRGRN